MLAQVLCGTAPVLAQEMRTEIGLLTCGLSEGGEAQTGAAASLRRTRKLLCTFRPAGNRPEETYTGTLQVVGLESEFSPNAAMIWIVKNNRGSAWSPGLLQQAYAAELAANPGLAPLIGETNASIVLQTLADEQAPAGADKVPQGTVPVVVVITLQLHSTAA